MNLKPDTASKELGKLTRLSRLRLTPDEQQKLQSDLQEITGFFSRIDRLSDADDHETSPELKKEIASVPPEPDTGPRFSQTVQENAPEFRKHTFIVPAVIDG